MGDEERLTRLERQMLEMERESIEKLTRLQSSVDEVKGRIPEWVTRVEFTPVKLIAYGLVSIILTSVLTAIVAIVVTGGHG